MTAVKELLLKTLDDLDSDKLRRFKWHLKNNHSCVSAADVEKAEATDTVDVMVARFTAGGAVTNTLTILRKMNENRLAEELQKQYEDERSAAQMSSGVVHTVNLNPQSGLTVNSPEYSGNSPESFGAIGQEPYYNSGEKKVKPIATLPSAGFNRPKQEHLLQLFDNRQQHALIDGKQTRLTRLTWIRDYAVNLTLDPNTAHPNILLSEGNRKATYVKEKQFYPGQQLLVLSQQSLSGRCYWEAEWSARMWADIVVIYKRVHNDYKFGQNNSSWLLKCSRHGYAVWHNNKVTNRPPPSPQSYRVGVYVDVSSGSLSFYSVSDTHTLTHLHTFNTTFTEHLHAGFRVHPDSSLSLCQI